MNNILENIREHKAGFKFLMFLITTSITLLSIILAFSNRTINQYVDIFEKQDSTPYFQRFSKFLNNQIKIDTFPADTQKINYPSDKSVNYFLYVIDRTASCNEPNNINGLDPNIIKIKDTLRIYLKKILYSLYQDSIIVIDSAYKQRNINVSPSQVINQKSNLFNTYKQDTNTISKLSIKQLSNLFFISDLFDKLKQLKKIYLSIGFFDGGKELKPFEVTQNHDIVYYKLEDSKFPSSKKYQFLSILINEKFETKFEDPIFKKQQAQITDFTNILSETKRFILTDITNIQKQDSLRRISVFILSDFIDDNVFKYKDKKFYPIEEEMKSLKDNCNIFMLNLITIPYDINVYRNYLTLFKDKIKLNNEFDECQFRLTNLFYKYFNNVYHYNFKIPDELLIESSLSLKYFNAPIVPCLYNEINFYYPYQYSKSIHAQRAIIKFPDKDKEFLLSVKPNTYHPEYLWDFNYLLSEEYILNESLPEPNQINLCRISHTKSIFEKPLTILRFNNENILQSFFYNPQPARYSNLNLELMPLNNTTFKYQFPLVFREKLPIFYTNLIIILINILFISLLQFYFFFILRPVIINIYPIRLVEIFIFLVSTIFLFHFLKGSILWLIIPSLFIFSILPLFNITFKKVNTKTFSESIIVVFFLNIILFFIWYFAFLKNYFPVFSSTFHYLCITTSLLSVSIIVILLSFRVSTK